MQVSQFMARPDFREAYRLRLAYILVLHLGLR